MRRPVKLPAALAAAAIIVLAGATGCSRWEGCRTLTLSFTGDIIMHIPVKTCAMRHNMTDGKDGSLNNSGFDYLFEKIAPEFTGSDTVQGNMEFPVHPPYTSKPWVFNCLPEVLPALRKAGFTMLTIANNHILDQGKEGLHSSISHLKKYGLISLGAGVSADEARAGYVLKKKNLAVGFLSYTRTVNRHFPKEKDGVYINNFNETGRVLDEIKAMRGHCDYLVLTVHSGNEYSRSPSTKDRKAFRECLEHGADLIIGHHPHILQEAEQYRTGDGRLCHIFYSLGNFISNQSSTFPVKGFSVPLSVRDSIIVKVRLRKEGGKVLQNLTVIPIRTVNERQRTGQFHRDIQPVSLPAEKRALKDALRQAKHEDRERINKQLQELNERSELVRKVLFMGKNIDTVLFEYDR